MHIFNRVKYQTPESVEIDFILAGIGSRAWALIIDYHILGLISVGFLYIWATIAEQVVNFWEKTFNSDKIGLWLLAIALLVNFFLYAGYFVVFETLWQGQTPGKRIAKIRVVRDDGRPVAVQQAVLRALLRPVDDFFFFLVGMFLIVLTPREKRLGDWVAGTIVIHNHTATARANISISEPAKSLSDQLLELADISALLPDDFAVIREYLLRRGTMAKKAKTDLSLQLAKQVKSVISLQKLPNRVTPDVFLEAVYLAYQGQSNQF
ncbi:MAG: RDD family protein [Nostocaceae cyanobacterium]|nr:RDD family protein [Nostocaceae cyanobacterium]